MSGAKVTVIDYGSGNLLSVRRALEHCGADVRVASTPGEVTASDRVLLPGVGAFGDSVAELRRRELVGCIHDFIATGRPLLGICVGMQILHEEGEEFGQHAGLGIIPGRVCRIPDTTAGGQPHRIPHIGWNALSLPEGRNGWEGTILQDIQPGETVYYVHSFTAHPTVPHDILAVSDYNGRRITAAVIKDNVTAAQFHPEKSGKTGLKMLSRFLSC